MSKKLKQNRYKPEPGEVSGGLLQDSGHAIDFCLKCIMIVAFISVFSLASIFIYDFCTQSNFFNIKNIKISGLERLTEPEVLSLADLNGDENIFNVNLYTIEKQIAAHPWIQTVHVKRHLKSIVSISIIEHTPLAIVKLENPADLIINTQGKPFKEFDPKKDRLDTLPLITGLELTAHGSEYQFSGPLFSSIMNLLSMKESDRIIRIKGNKNTGIIVDVKDTYNHQPENPDTIIQIKLGFDDFTAKLNKAGKISRYIDKNFPDKEICAMDIFNIHKVFIKTKTTGTLHTNLEKGV